MNRITVLAFIVIAAVAVMLTAILSLPEKAPECRAGDGSCPKGCSNENDRDCLRSSTTNLGTARACLADRDCIIVKPFCGNPDCGFSDTECNSGKFCATAISKNYIAAWQGGRAKCLQPISAECAPLEGFQAKCVIGECRAVSSSK